MADTELHITQVRSTIGAQQAQRRTLRSLGLRRPQQTVVRPDNPAVRGMLAKVAHLIEVRIDGQGDPVHLQPGQVPVVDSAEAAQDT